MPDVDACIHMYGAAHKYTLAGHMLTFFAVFMDAYVQTFAKAKACSRVEGMNSC